MRKSAKEIGFEVGAVLCACIAVALLCVPSNAQTKFLERIRKHYNLDHRNGKCELCHELKPKEEPGRKNLNVYGKAIQADPVLKPLLGKDDKYKFTEAELKTVEDAVSRLDSADSDGDGAKNKEELDLGTFPGDKKSIPDKLALSKYRKDHPPAADPKAGGADGAAGTPPVIGPRK